MVNEFPELQGIAGRHYALAAGEPKEIALAIDEAYQPRFAGDDIALSPLGKVLAIAERLDTLAGGFAAGLKPTGNKDPFALRRNALGLARTVIESGFDIRLDKLLDTSLDQAYRAILKTAMLDEKNKDKILEGTGLTLSWRPETPEEFADFRAGFTDLEWAMKPPSTNRRRPVITERENLVEDVASDLYDFILDRLRGYYADKGVPAAHFTAVAELKPASLYDFDTRLDAIGTFATLPEAEALAAANKRIGNILKKADIAIPHAMDRALLTDPAESALAEAVEAVLGETDEALHHHDYVTVLNHLARLRPQVDAFFDSVMVNADDPAVRANRLALLKRLADRFRAVAAIEHLSN
jgi:glycyl-tRNA synthetase beta chain